MKVDIENGMSREEKCLQNWQEEWNNTQIGAWTKTFIPDVKARIVTPITFGHYINQIITNHGDFNHRLHSFNLVENPSCECGWPEETAGHILEDCHWLSNQD